MQNQLHQKPQIPTTTTTNMQKQHLHTLLLPYMLHLPAKTVDKKMNKQQRIKELQRLFTTPENQLRPKEFKTFDDLHKRIEELVGRPVWTHEMAYPEMLYEEIQNGRIGEAFGKSLREISKTKPIIIVETK